jgi:hypothetical protein
MMSRCSATPSRGSGCFSKHVLDLHRCQAPPYLPPYEGPHLSQKGDSAGQAIASHWRMFCARIRPIGTIDQHLKGPELVIALKKRGSSTALHRRRGVCNMVCNVSWCGQSRDPGSDVGQPLLTRRVCSYVAGELHRNPRSIAVDGFDLRSRATYPHSPGSDQVGPARTWPRGPKPAAGLTPAAFCLIGAPWHACACM